MEFDAGVPSASLVDLMYPVAQWLRDTVPSSLKLVEQSEQLYVCYLLTGNFDDLQEVVRCAQEAVNLMPPEVKIVADMLQPRMHRGLFAQRLGFPEIAHTFVVVPSIVSIIRFTLARPLFRRFLHTGAVHDIERAIKLFRDAFYLLTDNNNKRWKCFRYWITSYLVRDGILDRRLKLNTTDEGSQSTPSVEVETLVQVRRTSFHTLIISYCLRDKIISEFQELCDLDLNSQSMTSLDIETLVHSLGEDDEVCNYVHGRFGCGEISMDNRSLDDVNSLVQISRQALNFLSSDHPKYGLMLIYLGIGCNLRFRQTTQLEDIDEAVNCFRDGLKSVPTTHPVFVYCLLHVGQAYKAQFNLRGRRGDLDDAFRFVEWAMTVVDSQEHPHYAVFLDSLAAVLVSRYESSGDVKDLDAAIHASSRAVNLAKGDLKVYTHVLCNHARSLELRFRRSNQLEDIRDAIATTQRIVDLSSSQSSRLISSLANLGGYECVLYSVTVDIKCLIRASEHMLRALHMCDHEDFGCRASDLPLLLSIATNNATLYDIIPVHRLQDTSGLDRFIALTRTATKQDFVRQDLAGLSLFRILGQVLFRRWELLSNIKDIDEAISTTRSLIDLAEARSNGIHELAMARTDLGKFLYHRRKAQGGTEYDAEALTVLTKGFRMSAATPLIRIRAGHLAVDILCEQKAWHRAYELCREISDLFVLINGRSLGWQGKQSMLREFSHRAATYASIALQAGSTDLNVIGILEKCRGSILGHLVDNRTDLDELMEADRELADRFRTLRDEINHEIKFSGNINSSVNRTTRRIEAEGEIRACLEEIRKREGFRSFLLGPTEEELTTAAAPGPIVIVNITSIRSDAIIITKDDVFLLRLSHLMYGEVSEYIEAELTRKVSDMGVLGQKNKKYVKMQKWLWNDCVKPILEKLSSGPPKLHVWWIGIGIASSLPFHAAGIYGRNSSETALSRAISSYTPTLKVLIHGRRKLKRDRPELDLQSSTSKPQAHKAKSRLVVVIMPSTPGMPNLGARKEADGLEKIVRDTFLTQIVEHPSANDTKALLAECEIAHFACHGASILTDPSSSHLLLQGTEVEIDSGELTIDKLTVREVAAMNLGHGKLALLAACSTAESKFPRLWDEGIHLVSAFHVAGYLHAIGNLWEVEDEVSVEVVKGFYTHLVAAGEFGDGESVAGALNQTLTNLAMEKPRAPLSWAPFVHFGG